MEAVLIALIPGTAAVIVALLGIVQVRVQSRSTSALASAQEAVARKEDLLDDQERRIANLEADRERERRLRRECAEELAEVRRRLDHLEAPDA